MPLPIVLGYTLWLMVLPPKEVEAILRRLLAPKRLLDIAVGAATLWAQREALRAGRPSKVTMTCETYPLTSSYALYLACPEEDPLHEKLARFAAEWRHVCPTVTGDDLRRLGLPPGPVYKRILRRLRAAWLDGEVRHLEEEHAFLDRLLAEVA